MAAPYDTVNAALNAARVKLNDEVPTLVAISGQLLDNSHPFSQQITNNAWRAMQRALKANGMQDFEQEVAFIAVPPCASTDPTVFCNLSWNGYFNGVATAAAPALPANLVKPINLWERVSGSGSGFYPMDLVMDGLPTPPKTSWSALWEWKDQAIYFIGSKVATDLRIRFEGFFADFADFGTTYWYMQQVPIAWGADILALFIAAEICGKREPDAADSFLQMGFAGCSAIAKGEAIPGDAANIETQPGAE